METFSRVYFSRYFYSIFKIGSKYKDRPLVNINQRTIFYSDIYYYNIKFNNKSTGQASFINWPTSSFSKNYLFPLIFPYRGDINIFYDYFWKPYEYNDEFFKKFIIIFIRLKFKYFTNFQLIFFIDLCKKLK